MHRGAVGNEIERRVERIRAEVELSQIPAAIDTNGMRRRSVVSSRGLGLEGVRVIAVRIRHVGPAAVRPSLDGAHTRDGADLGSRRVRNVLGLPLWNVGRNKTGADRSRGVDARSVKRQSLGIGHREPHRDRAVGRYLRRDNLEAQPRSYESHQIRIGVERLLISSKIWTIGAHQIHRARYKQENHSQTNRPAPG